MILAPVTLIVATPDGKAYNATSDCVALWSDNVTHVALALPQQGFLTELV
jgi:hypothetical protein